MMKTARPAALAAAAALCALMLSSCAAPKAAAVKAPEISDPGRTVCPDCGKTYIVTQE